MKHLISIVITAAVCSAHWTYQSIVHSGSVVGGPYQYIRKVSTSDSADPVYDIQSDDFRCGPGALRGGQTETLAVHAGDTIGFTLAGHNFQHPGPLQVYMSRATEKAANYDGSGEWTKIYSASTEGDAADESSWPTAGIDNFLFTLPKETPSGEYLLRAEAIGLHSAGPNTGGVVDRMGAQWYIGCAQVQVVGNVTGAMPAGVKIPGMYEASDPGILVDIWQPIPGGYKAPGPPLWPAGTQAVSKIETLALGAR